MTLVQLTDYLNVVRPPLHPRVLHVLSLRLVTVLLCIILETLLYLTESEHRVGFSLVLCDHCLSLHR